MGILGGADNVFSYKMIIFAVAMLFILPTGISLYTGLNDSDVSDEMADLMEDYQKFTGTKATKEAVWGLTGIYTPYVGEGQYGYTADGWLYGARVTQYTPSQYSGTGMSYTVTYDKATGLYRYAYGTDSEGNATEITYKNGDKTSGDQYNSIAMDAGQKSSIFFTPSGKVENGQFFYYEYSGYRYAFQPLADYTAQNSDGKDVPVTATTTSLSLIWYDYLGSQGISGQLVISGSDSGVAYLTAAEIIRAFDSVTSTSKFSMMFNGVDMYIYIRLNPYYVTTYSVQECFNLGYWDIMVTSLSTSAYAYVGTDYKFNPSAIFDTIIKLFTFNATDLGLSGWTATLASLMITVPLYAALISIGMTFYPVLIIAGILAAIQSLGHIF